MCLLALNLQHSCLLGLHQPAPSQSHTIVSPHHCPPTFASLPPCILQAPTLSPHRTITAIWHYHLTPSPFCTIVAYIPITPYVHPLPTLLPPVILATSHHYPALQISLLSSSALTALWHCHPVQSPSSPRAALCHVNATAPHTSPPGTTISTPWHLRTAPLLPPSSCHLAPSRYPSSSFSPCTVTTPHQPPHTFHAL